MINLNEMSKEERERRREIAYHGACESQYITAAAKIENPKMKAKALEHAAWHKSKAEYLESRKAR